MDEMVQLYFAAFDDDGNVPGSPPDQNKRYQSGPWFRTQLSLSLSIGLISFLLFCFFRTRNTVLFAPRTLLKGFSPHAVHDTPGFFSWIIPTLRTSEFTVLQIVGLDAAVLLSFMKLGFYYFLTCTILAMFVLVPINMRENGSTEGVPPEVPGNDTKTDDGSFLGDTGWLPGPITHGFSLYHLSHLIFTYVFSIIALFFLRRTYVRFVNTRQLFSLELAHSVPARTVMFENLPPHLRNDRALAEYWDTTCELPVESVSVVRDTGELANLLRTRTEILAKLENGWYKWLGNPVRKDKVPEYDPDKEIRRILDGDVSVESTPRIPQAELPLTGNGNDHHPVPGASSASPSPPNSQHEDHEDERDEEALLAPAAPLLTHPTRRRPTTRPSWFTFRKQDLLTNLAIDFRTADEAVRRRRRGKFRTTGVGFVTFETLSAAQIAAQVVHWPVVGEAVASLAPEPRDIHWTNITLTSGSIFVRRCTTLVLTAALLTTSSIPVGYLAGFLSYDTIRKNIPWLAKAIDVSPTLKSLVQTSLPGMVLIGFNALLPFLLEWLCIFQGLKAQSWIEYSLLKKYHIFLLFNVLFVFVAVSTFSLLKDLRDNPGQIIDKLAQSLPGARNFFTAYVMLQGIAIMPLQLLQLAVVIPRMFWKIFFTRTPRDYSELNAPPVLNLGTVYPQAILVFNVCVTYSVISPVILLFGTVYFGMGYLVYKYKLLFVYYRPFESRGQAWPITCNRIGWGLVIFQLFMLGLLSLRQAFLLSTLVAPLILITIYVLRSFDQSYKHQVRYVNLSQACEIQHGSTGDVARLKRGHPVTASQTNLNTRRYGHLDSSLYIVSQDEHTDYAQPPMSNVYAGVLDTGRRRYAHPAIFGQLPDPQLPIIRRSMPTGPDFTSTSAKAQGVVLNLRRRWSTAKAVGRRFAKHGPGALRAPQSAGVDERAESWRGDAIEEEGARRGGGDLGVVALNEDDEVGDDEEEDEEDATSGRTFYPHPERRKSQLIPGGWHGSEGEEEEGS